MRTISLAQILCFVALFTIACALGILSAVFGPGSLQLGDFRGVALVVFSIAFIYVYAILIYRVYLRIAPLQVGYVEPESKAEFVYHVYLLFHLVLFQPLTRSLLVPVPLMRMIYIWLGATLGRNSYSAGTILDPPLTRVGDNCIIGHDAVLFSHAVEGEDLTLAPIVLGNNVTIGAKAVIQPGVTVEDNSIVAVNAVVRKGTTIRKGELWGGIPAERIR